MRTEPEETGRWVEFYYEIQGRTEVWVDFNEDPLLAAEEHVEGLMVGTVVTVEVTDDPYEEDQRAHYAG